MLFHDFKCLSEIFCGFVYFRDLKIENLLLDEDNNIKLIGMTFFFFKQDYPYVLRCQFSVTYCWIIDFRKLFMVYFSSQTIL